MTNNKEIGMLNYAAHKVGRSLGKLFGNSKEVRGSQAGGFTLSSEFDTNTSDGAKTDATKGSSGYLNLDAIKAAFAGFGSGEAPNPEDLNEWMEMGKKIIEHTLEEKQKEKQKEKSKDLNSKKLPTVLPKGSDSCVYCHKVEPKDSLNNHKDNTKNYHGGKTQTKVSHTVNN